MIVDALTVLLKHSMGVQSCEIIMKDMFGKLDGVAATALAVRAIQNRAAEVSPTEMYVPVLGSDDVLALMYLKKRTAGHTSVYSKSSANCHCHQSSSLLDISA